MKNILLTVAIVAQAVFGGMVCRSVEENKPFKLVGGHNLDLSIQCDPNTKVCLGTDVQHGSVFERSVKRFAVGQTCSYTQFKLHGTDLCLSFKRHGGIIGQDIAVLSTCDYDGRDEDQLWAFWRRTLVTMRTVTGTRSIWWGGVGQPLYGPRLVTPGTWQSRWTLQYLVQQK